MIWLVSWLMELGCQLPTSRFKIMINSYSKDTSAFLNAVVNPFGASASARVPDSYSGNSVCLTDWCDTTPAVSGANAVNYQGVAFVPLIGWSWLKSSYSNQANMIYQILTLPLISSTGLIGLDAGNQLTSTSFVNYETITGSTTTVDLDDCLVDALRIFSLGIRAWPITEVVTNTSDFHITRWYAGSISPNSIYRSIVDGTNFVSILKNTDSIKMFAAHEGCTARLNPFQPQIDMLKIKSLTNMNMQAHDFSGVDVPIIACLFSEPRTYLQDAGCYINARLWIEGQLSLPTPIYSNMSPCDLNFDKISQIFSRPSEKHPLVTSGHTFQAFQFANSVLSDFLDSTSLVANNVSRVSQAVRTAIQPPRQRNRRRVNNNNNKNNNNRKRRQVLNGNNRRSSDNQYMRQILPRPANSIIQSKVKNT